jgi:hypothetical protein
LIFRRANTFLGGGGGGRAAKYIIFLALSAHGFRGYRLLAGKSCEEKIMELLKYIKILMFSFQ